MKHRHLGLALLCAACGDPVADGSYLGEPLLRIEGRIAGDAGTSDIRKGPSLGVTLKVTEFHHWRAEFQRVESNFGPARNRLNLQFQWIIGAHPAHKY